MRRHCQRLLLAEIVERLVESSLELTGSVGRGAAVPHEDQHGFSVNHTRRAGVRGVSKASCPVRQAWRRRDGSVNSAARTTHATNVSPAISSGTFHQPRAAIGNRTSSNPPLNGHQNVDVAVHAPV